MWAYLTAVSRDSSMSIRSFFIACLIIPSCVVFGTAAEPSLPPAARRADFERHIRPILEHSCVGCHGAVKQKGDFRLDTKDFLHRGGQSGKVVVPGKSARERTDPARRPPG